MVKLYKIPLNYEDDNFWVPQENNIDEILAEYSPVKEFTEDNYHFLKEGALKGKIKFPRENNFLDFNYLVIDNTNIKYFNKTKLYFFVNNELLNLQKVNDNFEYNLHLDIFVLFGNLVLNNLVGKNVKVQRNHINRFFNEEQENLISYEDQKEITDLSINDLLILPPPKDINLTNDKKIPNFLITQLIKAFKEKIPNLIKSFKSWNGTTSYDLNNFVLVYKLEIDKEAKKIFNKFYKVVKLTLAYNKKNNKNYLHWRLYFKKNYNNNFRTSNKRDYFLWQNKEFEFNLPLGTKKEIQPLNFNNNDSDNIWDNNTKKEVSKLIFELMQNNKPLNNYFLFLVIANSTGRPDVNNYVFIPVFPEKDTTRQNDIITKLKALILNGDSWINKLQKQTFTQILKDNINLAVNFILTTKPFISVSALSYDGKNIDIYEKKRPLFESFTINKKEYSVLDRQLTNEEQFINIQVKDFYELENKERNLPILINNEKFLTLNLEPVIKNSNYEKHFLIDVNNNNDYELENFDLYNSNFLSVSELFIANGSKYTFKILDSQNLITYENDNSIPFSINKLDEYFALNNNRLTARQREIDINYKNSMINAAVSGGLGVLGGAATAIGYSGVSSGLGLLQIFNSLATTGTQINQAESSYKIQKNKIKAEILDKGQEKPDIKNPNKEISSLFSPFNSNIENGKYGFYETPQNILKYDLPLNIKKELINYFNKFGYDLNTYFDITKDFLTSRFLYNYIQIENISEFLNTSNIPLIIINEFEKYFNKGVRLFWCRKLRSGIETNLTLKQINALKHKIFSLVDFQKVNYEKWIVDKKLIEFFKP